MSITPNYLSGRSLFVSFEGKGPIAPMKQIVAPNEEIKYWDPIAQYQSWQQYRSNAGDDKYNERRDNP